MSLVSNDYNREYYEGRFPEEEEDIQADTLNEFPTAEDWNEIKATLSRMASSFPPEIFEKLSFPLVAVRTITNAIMENFSIQTIYRSIYPWRG